MALPYLVKYVYAHSSDEILHRAKKIQSSNAIELVEYDDIFGSAIFRVKDDLASAYYKVHIQKIKSPKQITLRCACNTNPGNMCCHQAASILQLQNLMDQGKLNTQGLKYEQRHTVAKMRMIDAKTLRLLSSNDIVNEAENFLQYFKPVIETAQDELVKAKVNIDGKIYQVIIHKNDERNFDTSSDYLDENHLLCLPKVIVFLYLFKNYGAFYFDSIRNWDKEKNKLLEAYGYSIKDELKGKFEFVYKEGKPFLRVLNSNIKRIATVTSSIQKPKAHLVQQTLDVEKTNLAVEIIPSSRIGIVFNFNNRLFPFFILEAITGEANENQDAFVGNVEKLDLTKYIDTTEYCDADIRLLEQVRKFSEVEVKKFINQNNPFFLPQENSTTITNEEVKLIQEYLYPKIKKWFFNDWPNLLSFELPNGKNFVTANLIPLHFSKHVAKPVFSIKKNSHYTIQCYVKAGGVDYLLEENETTCPLFFLYNSQMFLWQDEQDIETISTFLPKGNMEFTADQWPNAIRNIIIPLTQKYLTNFDKSLVEEIKDCPVEISVFLKEQGEFLIFSPLFTYQGIFTPNNQGDAVFSPKGNQVLKILRRTDKENEFIQQLRNLHSHFVENVDDGTLILKGNEVLKDNWFFLFIDEMKTLKASIFGFEALKNFRFNTAKPQTKIFISSHTDWFDAKVDISFGEQKVNIDDIKQALAQKQQFVQLGDGSLGILPEDWLKKYSLLFRVGEGKADVLKISPYHASVIDELYDSRDENEMVLELEAKYNRLKTFNQIDKIDPPLHLQSILRPYQQSGFQWLHYLQQVGWGGILADDMGLGKTVQALSYLEYFKAEKNKLLAMVVCPTTLIYNWENEIKKFTPSLSYRIHHGPDRLRDKNLLETNNIIITTYGTLRSDIKLFTTINFDYVVMDESQAIKNPSSKVSKASGLLKSKHRLCMSGTPLQNNTFDIFSQMNFLNPGMLGTVEFFRQDFAIPIDKFDEKERKEHLRKLLYPFILRRTKEQVAKDLPEKQEMILWCQMEDAQRQIYEAYRNDYREKILGAIEQQGIQRSQLTILQGLMKLRQICDSPAILNEEDKYENHSIKLEELAREVTENISNHKALIFSQFLGMLALIRHKLDELKIKYVYFDGSTPAPDREKAIQEFQQNDEVRVFLISLKAGGVGLNLTAADYVYIVDPWWNPAVEQQAIDRTHRIGQTKNIFAYRMICKDTIEDKIVKLQEKKRFLAKELITDDSGFVKSLSREDVEFLFS